MPPLTEDAFFQTIPEWNEQLRAKSIRAQDLTQAFLDRLDRIGPRLNAVALMLAKDALQQAKTVDQDLKRDRFRGWLQGIPFGAKDILAVAGRKTQWGAPQFAEQEFKETAAVLRRLRRGGAILAAKLSMIELAGGGGYRSAGASVNGPCRNPWDLSRWAGGSSSGSAAAVAAGLAPFAIGSETSGSIITPCAFCGVTGLRPTYGLVSRAGAMALSWSMDKIGPIGRTAEDCGRILETIAGGDVDDPGSAKKSFRFFPQFAPKPAAIRAGYSRADIEQSADPVLRPALREAVDTFGALGVELVEVSLPDLPYTAIASTIIGAEAASVFEDLIGDGRIRQLIDPHQAAGLAAASEIRAVDYLRACRIRSLIRADFARLFSKVDVLISPACFWPAPPLDEPLDRAASVAGKRPAGGLRRLGPAGNLAGLPAITVPCGMAQGLPVGLMLVSRPFTENQILALAMGYQAKTDWHKRRPVL